MSHKDELSQFSQPLLTGKVLQSLNIFVVLPWTCSSEVCNSHTPEPKIGPSPPGVTKAEQRGRIISLKLLAMFCLMHPRVLSAFFAMRVCGRDLKIIICSNAAKDLSLKDFATEANHAKKTTTFVIIKTHLILNMPSVLLKFGL